MTGFLWAQSPARPAFDAASVKLNVDGTPYVFNGMKSPGMYSAENQTLRNLIQEAYGIPSGRRSWLPFFAAAGLGMPIVGGPKWMGTERYDITAKWKAAAGDGRVTRQSLEKAESEMELMLRSLLEERFQVKVHRETRNLPVYEMTMATPGKLKQGVALSLIPAIRRSRQERITAARPPREGRAWTGRWMGPG